MDADLKKMRRASDSFLTSIFARSISVLITPLVAKTPITPMQVTLFGLFIGLMAAWQASKAGWPNHLTAALLLELSHVLDCIDGELARLTGRGNPFAAALDPITDRIKDIFIIYAAFVQSMNPAIFDWPESTLFGIAFFTVGFWLLYMYIVDAYLNPARKKRPEAGGKLYVGLYDLFIYGAIVFLVANLFAYFNLYVFVLAISGAGVQFVRLFKLLR
jgi:phosphatidylglycerophosphate synthase